MFKMQTQWITVNEVPTKVLSWGKTVKEANENANEENSNYIVCIPGNPGIVDMYVEFLDELHKNTGNTVWIIAHAGHYVDTGIKMPLAQDNKDLYSLEGQIKHKISFIEDLVPKGSRITLIGHSIGSYIILNILKVPSIQSRVINNYLLFPTFENMAESKNGKFFVKYVRHLFPLLLFLAAVFNLFPLLVQNFLVYIYLKLGGIPDHFLDCIRNFIKPFTINNVIGMALEEMVKVKQRDNAALKENINRIKIYYGAEDGWCPISNYYNIKKDIPNINAEICDKGFTHAFVIRDSVAMSELVVKWIKVQ